MSIPVTGRVSVANGAAYLELVPSGAPAARANGKSRPSAGNVLKSIEEGKLVVHPSRTPVTREVVNSALVTVQRKLQLRTGTHGQWTSEADDLLAKNLRAPKRGSEKLALPAPSAPLALPAPADDANNSASDSSNESRDTKRQKTTSSSSSSSSSSSTRKSTLRHRLSQLRSECTEYLGAIFHHQQIEQENEELKTLCDSLTAENQELRAAQSKN